MATINLGSIKFKWKGTYNGATAYTVDDVVEYNGSSYICILASTGNLPTDTTYFEQMSSAGTNGTDGTDLTTTLTTQGDIVYRDGSGLQRLGAGTSGQVLQTNGTGANPSWGTVSSDLVLLNHTDSTSAVSSHTFQSIFDDTVYAGYKIFLQYELPTDATIIAYWLNGSTQLAGSTDYRRAGYEGYRREDNSDLNVGANADGDGRDSMNLNAWGFSDATGNMYFTEGQIFGALQDTSIYKCAVWDSMQRDNSGGVGDYFASTNAAFTYINYSQSVDGIQFATSNSSNFERFKCSIYGLKK